MARRTVAAPYALLAIGWAFGAVGCAAEPAPKQAYWPSWHGPLATPGPVRPGPSAFIAEMVAREEAAAAARGEAPTAEPPLVCDALPACTDACARGIGAACLEAYVIKRDPELLARACLLSDAMACALLRGTPSPQRDPRADRICGCFGCHVVPIQAPKPKPAGETR